MAPSPSSYGRIIGRSIAAARNQMRLSQAAVAVRMSALGYSWHQQTVGAVESGTRRVTAEEILGLAWALMTPINTLIKPADDDKVVELPSGKPIDALAVTHSVNGVTLAVINWEDNVPVFSSIPAELLAERGGLTVPLTPAFAAMLFPLEKRIAELEAREKVQPEPGQ